MSQVSSGRVLAAVEMVRFQGSPWWIFGKQSGSGTGLPQNNSAFPCQYHPTIAPDPFIYVSPALHSLNNSKSQKTKYRTRFVRQCALMRKKWDVFRSRRAESTHLI